MEEEDGYEVLAHVPGKMLGDQLLVELLPYAPLDGGLHNETRTPQATLNIEGMGAHHFLLPAGCLNPYGRTIGTDYEGR